MWRRFGEAAFAAVALVIFTVQTGALLFVAWTFFFREDRSGTGGMRAALAGSVSLAALAVLALTAWILGYQWVSAWRERRRQRGLARLRGLWAQSFYGGPEPRDGASGISAEALIGLREQLRGPEAAKVDSILDREGVTDRLLRRAGRRRHRLGARLDALDLVYRAGSPAGFDGLRQLCDDPELPVRALALRALARAVGAIPDASDRESEAVALAERLGSADVPRGVIDEALLNAGPALAPVARWFLVSGDPQLQAAALDAAGRAHLLEIADLVPPFLDNEELEVRCAAWRALTGIGTCPPGVAGQVSRALATGDEAERSQAARFAHLLPVNTALDALSPRLADASWWVRRSAAWALIRSGGKGRRLLWDAASRHPDRFARSIAIEVLVDAGELTAGEAAALKETAA